MSRITQTSQSENPPQKQEQPSVQQLQQELKRRCEEVCEVAQRWAQRSEPVTFKELELALRLAVFAIGRAAITLFLALRERYIMRNHPRQLLREKRRLRQAPAQGRHLVTIFGAVRYWRTYFREVAKRKRRGFYPLDASLGLVADRYSWNVMSRVVLLATKLSFAEARQTLGVFQPQAPSTEVIEKAVLGLGRYTAEWFVQAPPPCDDGEVLIIMIDSKGAPMATKQELRRRRGKRKKRRLPASARHRGRARRWRYGSKPRRKKGDKSKNAKMATLAVMYTLKRHGRYLLGPRNRWVYGSFAPKRHAFEIARREADKRGFTPESGKQIQLVTDGDEDLACYATDYFPEAVHTIDVIHVVEKLWDAGKCVFREGSAELTAWVEKQKKRLYGGEEEQIVEELDRLLQKTPKTGPGNKGRRKRLTEVHNYIEKRLEKMYYAELREMDLELSSGAVEGAVKNIIGKRCDHGGMRWIKERAEAVLQLRCIEANGDWDAFINFVHDRMQAKGDRRAARLSLQCSKPAPLPKVLWEG